MQDFNVCRGVDGMMWFVRDGAGKLYSFDGVRAVEPTPGDLRDYVRRRTEQIAWGLLIRMGASFVAGPHPGLADVKKGIAARAAGRRAA